MSAEKVAWWIILMSLQLTQFSFASTQPIIIDTDIGSFYDDFMAIATAVKNPIFDIKLLVTCSDDTVARAKVAAKFLTLLGYDHIPIGIGLTTMNKTEHALFGWAEDFDLATYRGTILENGISAMAKVIENSSIPVNILALGPMTNFPMLLNAYPDVISNARIKAAGGSIYHGYRNSSKPVPEYNFAVCSGCVSQVLQAGWNITIAPLDITSVGTLTPLQTRSFLEKTNTASLVIGNTLVYYCSNASYFFQLDNCNFSISNMVYFDAVATLLLFPNSSDFFIFKELNISMNSDGFSVVDSAKGAKAEVALNWNGVNNDAIDKYRDYISNTLTN